VACPGGVWHRAHAPRRAVPCHLQVRFVMYTPSLDSIGARAWDSPSQPLDLTLCLCAALAVMISATRHDPWWKQAAGTLHRLNCRSR